MTPVLNYFLEAHLAILVVAVADYLLLRHETDVSFRRKLLLSGVGLALLLPLLHVPSQPLNETLPTLAYRLPEETLLPTYSDMATSGLRLSAFETGAIAYAIGTLVFLIHTGYQMARLVTLRGRLPRRKFNQQNFFELPEKTAAFSFFNQIFIPRGPARTIAYMFKHEVCHGRLGHSYDILGMEVVKAFFWINPAIYEIRRRLSAIHEFEADREVLKQADAEEYESTLVAEALRGIHYPLGNHFNQSLLIRRIDMMKRLTKSIEGWRIAVLAVTTMAITVFIACQDQIQVPVKASLDLLPKQVPDLVRREFNRLQTANPYDSFMVIDISKEAGRITMEGLPPSAIAEITIIKSASHAIIKLHAGSSRSRVNEPALTSADKPAQPPSGFERYKANLSKLFKYPSDVEPSIEGRVFVEFTVNEDGTLTNFNLLRGIHPKIDLEILRILKLSSNWIPAEDKGKVVRMKVVVPVEVKNQKSNL